MESESPKELTDVSYWRKRYSDRPRGIHLKSCQLPHLECLVPLLKGYEGQRFLELGCEPGLASATIASRLNFQFHGVDFLPDSGNYREAMKAVGFDAVRITADFRNVPIREPYDVVASFGLIEHFENPLEVMAAQDRCLRSGGLCVITLPNLRKLQFIYHWLFDLPDLKRHNLSVMNPNLLRQCGRKLGHEILLCQHLGKLRFWGFERSGSLQRVAARALGAMGARALAMLSGSILPAGHPWFAPFIVYAAKKR